MLIRFSVLSALFQALLVAALALFPEGAARAADLEVSAQASQKTTPGLPLEAARIAAISRVRLELDAKAAEKISQFKPVEKACLDSRQITALAEALFPASIREEKTGAADQVAIAGIAKGTEKQALENAGRILSDPGLLRSYENLLTREQRLLVILDRLLAEEEKQSLGPRASASQADIAQALGQVVRKLAAIQAAHLGYDAFYLQAGKEDPARALDFAARATGLDPELAPAWRVQAKVFLATGRYENAIIAYSRALRFDPDDASAHQDRGVAYSELGRFKEAVGDYSEAIRLEPGFTSAWAARGFANMVRGDSRSGCRDLEKACELGDCRFLKMARDKGACP